MVQQVKNNPHTTLGTDFCPAHIPKVWDAISEFIKQQFCLGHGVKIPGNFVKSCDNYHYKYNYLLYDLLLNNLGFATITYKVFQTDVSQTNAIVDKIPLMLLSENLVKTYALKSKRPAFNLDVRY